MGLKFKHEPIDLGYNDLEAVTGDKGRFYTDPEGNGTISIHYGSPSGLGDLPDRMLVGSLSDSNVGFGIEF